MSDIEEPELHLIRFPDVLGAEWRARAERQRAESRTRYAEYLASALAELGTEFADGALAAFILDALTVWNDITSGERCVCSCHPRLPEGDLHDYGFACSCRQTPETRRRNFDEWFAEMDEYWASPDGQRITAAREAERKDVVEWLADHRDVAVRSHGGMAPEQWLGEVDGHSFYFRERHDQWHIELDLRPTGRFSTVLVGGDLDDDESTEQREIEAGDVIAEGTTRTAGYGDTPVERLRFIVDVIRAHLLRQSCTVHTTARDDLELLFGGPLPWCPACGLQLSGVAG